MSPRPRTTSDATILAALTRVISRIGPAKLTLADVAAEAGHSRAGLVQRFGSKRGLLLAVAAVAVLALVVAAVLLVLTDRRADRAADQAEDAASRLLGFALPSDVDPDDCTALDADGDVVRELQCGPTEDGEGPTSARYSVATEDAAADAFSADVAAQDLAQLTRTYDCGSSSGEGQQGWVPVTDTDTDGEEVTVGRVACWVDGDGDSVFSWTWPDLGVRAVVELRGGGTDGLSDLQSWWRSTADRGY